jgi:hypothetical protein
VNASVPKEAMNVLEAALIVLVAVASRFGGAEDRRATPEPASDPPPTNPDADAVKEGARS